jgi:hypothetical protein
MENSEHFSPFTPLTREEELRLWPLAVHARHLLRNLRYVDYRQAEEDTALLAQAILDRYTPAELRRSAFTAIPRGGLVVLGLLAYQLDLHPDQLVAGSARQPERIFLVDDCALSGSRLRGTLPQFSDRPVSVTHLYSTPGLRMAVCKAFPNVTDCLAARDLAENEEDTSEIGRLHPGPTEFVAFAWNEPDLLVQTPFEKMPRHEWRFLPPHQCLNNRQALALPPAPPVSLEWIVPKGIVYGWFDPILYLLDTGSETVYRLDNQAAGCWRAAAGYGNIQATLSFLQNHYPDDDPANLKRTFEQNLIQFQEKGLLQRNINH